MVACSGGVAVSPLKTRYSHPFSPYQSQCSFFQQVMQAISIVCSLSSPISRRIDVAKVFQRIRPFRISDSVATVTTVQTHRPQYKLIVRSTNLSFAVQTCRPQYKFVVPSTNLSSVVQIYRPQYKFIVRSTNSSSAVSIYRP